MIQLKSTRHSLVLEDQSLPIVIRKHPTSRRIILRYQPQGHYVSVTIPRYTAIRQGLDFAHSKRDWVARQLAERAKPVPFADGQTIPIFAVPHRICHIGGRGLVRCEDDQLLIPGELPFLVRRLREFLIKQAREAITSRARHDAEMIGQPLGKITLRDTRSHWGSCTSGGNLSFSWRLIFAPREVLEYVVAHEVAHLAELNHSAAFWRIVARLCPEYKASQAWLKMHGQGLWNYG